MPAPDEDTPDVLPPRVNQVMAALWILLLGGRWLATPFLMTDQIVTQNNETYVYINPLIRDELDKRILLPCYLVLLIVTLVVLALRFARQTRKSASPE